MALSTSCICFFIWFYILIFFIFQSNLHTHTQIHVLIIQVIYFWGIESTSLASMGMWNAIQDCIRFDCLLCALFDKSVIVFVFFNVFYLISLENRAELICSPAVSLSLNYAEAKDCFSLSAALFLRIISGLYSPSVGVAELYSTRGESTLRKSSVAVQSQTERWAIQGDLCGFVVQKIHSESRGHLCGAILWGKWNIILVKEAILHYWHSCNMTWPFLPVRSWEDFKVHSGTCSQW